MAKHLVIVIATLWLASLVSCEDKKELLVLTVATQSTDGFQRYMRSAAVYGYNVKVLGMGEVWRGGEMATGEGGGQKINLLRQELVKYKDREDLVILFTDSYDVMFADGPAEILQKFSKFKSSIVFGAEDTCWPDASLAAQYPKVSYGYRYLNSGGFIGLAPSLYSLVAPDAPVDDGSDDQLYYSLAFVDSRRRADLGMALDSQARIFQNLNNNAADVSLKFKPDDTRLLNTVFQSKPVVVHGNGPSKVLLASLGNYLAKSWTLSGGCLSCEEGRRDLRDVQESSLPLVLVSVFVERGTPFLQEMLERVEELRYPKARLHYLVHSQIPKHDELLGNFTARLLASGAASARFIAADERVKEWHARNRAVSECLSLKCDALFCLDSEAHLDNPDTLSLLLDYNRPILGAVMLQPGRAWSTFWGAVTPEGFYARSSDYMDIVNGNRRGIWAVPHITGAYLMKRSVLEDERTRPNYIHNLLDADMAMTANYRDKDVLMYTVNLDDYGHLVDSSAFDTDQLNHELWQMVTNRQDWERRYLHPDYHSSLNPDTIHKIPCPDVYWFPIFSERFCAELVDTMENFGTWSGGKNTDERISGGYENVPTVDIHMTQVGYQQEGLWILKEYVKPLAEKVFLGYTSDARADLIFVVRYRPTEQSFLRPHHDSSTYTINVALNPTTAYEGGGARFIRYNCSVVDTQVGWALMHPGRLTHYHEGLPTTAGTRYILVSFIDP